MNAAVANSLASGFSLPFLSQTAAMDVSFENVSRPRFCLVRPLLPAFCDRKRGDRNRAACRLRGSRGLGRLAGYFRDLRGFHYEIGLVATAETATHQSGVDVYFSRGRPETLAIISWAHCGACVGTQASAPSGRMCTVQFIGSMQAWGAKAARTRLRFSWRQEDNAASASPSLRTVFRAWQRSR